MSTDIVCSNKRAAKGYVFIRYQPKWLGLRCVAWRRAKRETVIRRGWQKRVITCASCRRPAVVLDCHWPYMTDFNACEQHAKHKEKHNG